MTSLSDRQLEEWKAAVSKLGRVPPEWVGKNPDAKVPERVKDRILRTWEVCHLSSLPIAPGTPWEVEHVIPLSMGGQHRESNMRPALAIEHRKKTRQEAKDRAKADRARRAGNGTKTESSAKIQNAGFAPKPEKDRSAPSKTRIGTGQWFCPLRRQYFEY